MADTVTLSRREETIKTLLSWWVDVLEGWSELGRGADDFGVKMMGRAYNHPSYIELRRCMVALRDEECAIYWHLAQTYRAHRRTVLACPRCDAVSEVAAKHFDSLGNVTLRHRHDGPVFFVRKTVPAVSAAVDPEIVEAGIRWLGERFRGEPFIPDELLAKERAA